MSLWGENSVWVYFGGIVVRVLANALKKALQEIVVCPAEEKRECPLKQQEQK